MELHAPNYLRKYVERRIDHGRAAHSEAIVCGWQPLSSALRYEATSPKTGSIYNFLSLAPIPARVARLEREIQERSSLNIAEVGSRRTPLRGRITGPVQFLWSLMEKWGLTPKELAILLDYEDEKSVKALLDGWQTLKGRDRKTRIQCLFVMRALLDGLFRDAAVEREWIREPQEELGNESLLSLMLEGSIENLLRARQFLEHSVAGL